MTVALQQLIYLRIDTSLHLEYYIANQKKPVLTRDLFES